MTESLSSRSRVPNGSEVIVHATNLVYDRYKDRTDYVMLKIDYEIAFNTVTRKAFLEVVQRFCPEILQWVIQIYSHET